MQVVTCYSAGRYPAPSAGAIRGFSAYIYVNNGDNTTAQLLHGDLVNHLVTPLWETSRGDLESVFPGQPCIPLAPICIFPVATTNRYEAVYGSRGGRFALIEAGALASYVINAASNVGLAGCLVGGFDDSAASHLLDLRLHDACLLAISLGSTDE